MDRTKLNSNIKNTENNYFDIPDTGAVFLCGKTRFDCEKFHVKNDSVIQVSCGDEHTGIITGTGRVFMFGSNHWGQLGLGHEKNVEKPSCVKSLKHEKVKLIACGRNHTIIATESGYLYGFGSNSENQLGLGDVSNQVYNTPQKLPLESKNWKIVSVGASHSCALTENGELYVWGLNENGELGLKNVDELKKPTLIEDINFKVDYVTCGYYHTAIITKDGKLFVCGNNESGQLGLIEKSSSVNHFSQVTFIKEPVIQVACGGQHTIVLTKNNCVYSFGEGSKGQLGLSSLREVNSTPEKLKLSLDLIVKQISCGESHTAIISDKGNLYVCGDNSNGKLGVEEIMNQNSLVKVEKFSQLNIKFVSCGGCHMVMIATLITVKDTESKLKKSFDQTDKKINLVQPLKNINSIQSPNLSKKQKIETNKSSDDSTTDSDEENEGNGDLNASQTFNKTHTLTKTNELIPLSELNIKRVVDDENIKNKQPNSFIHHKSNLNSILSSNQSKSSNDKNNLFKNNTSVIKAPLKINEVDETNGTETKRLSNQQTKIEKKEVENSKNNNSKPPTPSTRTCVLL